MTTPKIFMLDGVNKVFQSDVPIKGIDYVAVYTSTNGLSNSYSLVSQSLYEIINDSLVFFTAPTGSFLRLVVGTNKSELLNSPSNIAIVATNMELLDFVAKNIDVIIDSYNVVATAENMDKITLVGTNMNSIVANNTNIVNIDLVGTNINNVNLVGGSIDNVNLVGTNILSVNNLSTNMTKLSGLYTQLTKLVDIYNNLTDIINVSDAISAINIINSGTNLTKIGIVSNSINNVNLVGGSIDNVNLVASNLDSIINRSKFKVKSISALSLDLKANPKSPVLTALPEMVGFELNTVTNSIKNVSGRDVDIIGTMSIQITTASTSGVVVYAYSETSVDGVNWTINGESLRKTKLDKDGTDYVTFPSMLIASKWINGAWIRFKFYKEGAGDATLNTVSDTVNGNSVTGNSFVWTLHEV